jgi:hypothetical protein
MMTREDKLTKLKEEMGNLLFRFEHDLGNHGTADYIPDNLFSRIDKLQAAYGFRPTCLPCGFLLADDPSDDTLLDALGDYVSSNLREGRFVTVNVGPDDATEVLEQCKRIGERARPCAVFCSFYEPRYIAFVPANEAA